MTVKSLRLLFVADGRSPIALNWMRYFVEHGDSVHLATTFPAEPPLHLASVTFVPVAFSQAKAGQPGSGSPSPARSRSWIWKAGAVGLRTKIRQWFGPLTVPSAGQQIRRLVETIRPDLVHAMRIPYEGMAAAYACSGLSPLVVSIWGNDFTLHAPSSPFMGWLTRRCLERAAALHADCQRDLRLAQRWGFNPIHPSIDLPGAGGLQLELFQPPQDESARQPMVINPRGIRAYIRSDTFFRSIPLVLAQRPEVKFVCTAVAGDQQAEEWVRKLDIGHAVQLLPAQTRPQMAALFQQAQVMVSPSTHDGTPNTLLEALACGCFPVAGDLDSLREWIQPGENGLLVDSANPQSLAGAVLQALTDADLRTRAARLNSQIIGERADYRVVMPRAAEFYEKIILLQAGTRLEQ